jgi:hypothetical protein
MWPGYTKLGYELCDSVLWNIELDYVTLLCEIYNSIMRLGYTKHIIRLCDPIIPNIGCGLCDLVLWNMDWIIWFDYNKCHLQYSRTCRMSAFENRLTLQEYSNNRRRTTSTAEVAMGTWRHQTTEIGFLRHETPKHTRHSVRSEERPRLSVEFTASETKNFDLNVQNKCMEHHPLDASNNNLWIKFIQGIKKYISVLGRIFITNLVNIFVIIWYHSRK